MPHQPHNPCVSEHLSSPHPRAHFPGQRQLGGPERARGQASAAGKPFLPSKSHPGVHVSRMINFSCLVFFNSSKYLERLGVNRESGH